MHSLFKKRKFLIFWPQSWGMKVVSWHPPTRGSSKELFKPLTMWATGPSAGWLWAMNATKCWPWFPFQVRTMGGAWGGRGQEQLAEQPGWLCRGTKVTERRILPAATPRSPALPTQSGLQEGGLRGSAAFPCLLQQWHTGTKSLWLSQPCWGETRSCSDGCMVAQYRRSLDRWFLCHL